MELPENTAQESFVRWRHDISKIVKVVKLFVSRGMLVSDDWKTETRAAGRHRLTRACRGAWLDSPGLMLVLMNGNAFNEVSGVCCGNINQVKGGAVGRNLDVEVPAATRAAGQICSSAAIGVQREDRE
jgi:hypothetical protein